jgi:hypothetical protein
LDCRHLTYVIVREAAVDPSAIHKDVECPRNNKKDVVFFCSLFNNRRSRTDLYESTNFSDPLRESLIPCHYFLCFERLSQVQATGFSLKSLNHVLSCEFASDESFAAIRSGAMIRWSRSIEGWCWINDCPA